MRAQPNWFILLQPVPIQMGASEKRNLDQSRPYSEYGNGDADNTKSFHFYHLKAKEFNPPYPNNSQPQWQPQSDQINHMWLLSTGKVPWPMSTSQLCSELSPNYVFHNFPKYTIMFFTRNQSNWFIFLQLKAKLGLLPIQMGGKWKEQFRSKLACSECDHDKRTESFHFNHLNAQGFNPFRLSDFQPQRLPQSDQMDHTRVLSTGKVSLEEWAPSNYASSSHQIMY